MQVFQLLRQGGFILGAILLPNLGVSQEVIGHFEQLLYIGYSLTFFWVAGLVQGMLSSYSDHSRVNQERFLFNAYLLFTVIAGVLSLLMWRFPGLVFALLTHGAELPYYELFVLYLLLNTPTFLLENIFILRGTFKPIYYYGFFSFVVYISALAVPVLWGNSFYWVIVALTALALIKHIYLIALVARSRNRQLDFVLLKRWVLLAMPLMAYAFLGGLMQTFDAWIINYWYDGSPRQFAIYRYGARELPLVLALSTALASAMLPALRKDQEMALKSLKYKSLQLFHWLFPFSIVLMATSNYWYPLVFTRAFDESIIIFDTYLLIIVSRLIFSRTVLISLQDNKSVLYISVVELMVNILLSFVLIVPLGLSGVALATLLSFMLEKGMLCWYLWYRHGIGLRHYLAVKWWAFYTVLITLLFLLKSWGPFL